MTDLHQCVPTQVVSTTSSTSTDDAEQPKSCSSVRRSLINYWERKKRMWMQANILLHFLALRRHKLVFQQLLRTNKCYVMIIGKFLILVSPNDNCWKRELFKGDISYSRDGIVNYAPWHFLPELQRCCSWRRQWGGAFFFFFLSSICSKV